MKRLITGFAMALLLWSQPAAAQSILRDAETEALFAEMANPIAEAAGLDKRNFRVVLINDKSINAFVAGGQIVYLHSGLIDAADTANEVQGVIAHEVGHITGGHVPLGDRMGRGAMGITLLSLVLGAAAMAAGAGEAGAGILAAGNRAALGNFLAFSRVQESSADAAGASFLNKASIPGKGMLSFFRKLQAYEYRLAIPQDNSYERSHPLSGERIANLTGSVRSSAAWDKPLDAGMEARFKRVQAKLRGYVNDPKTTLARYPASDQSAAAHYARAYAYHLSGYPVEAAKETQALVATSPDDPYFLELEGQILLESGKPEAAIPALREAVQRSDNAPLVAATFAHALLATEDSSHLDEAEKVLNRAVARDNENPGAWVQLAMVYERKGDEARLALARAEQLRLLGYHTLALASAQNAVAMLPPGSREALRAQDLVVISRTEIDLEKDRR
ncbi:M48 family metalloprotease [Sphingomonas japonica]|uniref:Zn-dependent protease n=1 Tax=Sphingomonas japonica TaxID=511662 RepID=A0ABX0U0K2_9SPHN|nr:M48 family metalloprotease [Sphingomonas japonica]NIJ24039.1 putative Zn-dependent protease [Sphingomonas japonica]